MPLAISQSMGGNRHLMFQAYCEVFYSLLVKDNFRTLKMQHWLNLGAAN